MSSEPGENTIHTDPVDVNNKVKENGIKSEQTCDSGVETADTFSDALSSFPRVELLASESTENQFLFSLKDDPETTCEVESNITVSSSSSLSPDIIDVTDNLGNSDDNSSNKNNLIPTETEQAIENKDIIGNPVIDEKLSNPKEKYDFESPSTYSVDNMPKRDENKAILSNMTPDSSPQKSQLENSLNKNFTASSVSLVEITDDKNISISNSQYSRSSENISSIGHSDKISENFEQKDFNQEKILTEFANQKTKAAATQRITPELSKTIPEIQNLDLRYSRLPKELITQDLGSIVKNVHGIFSSVSGSLKNAYNQTQKTPKIHPRSIKPSSKIMDDIFEDEVEKPIIENNQNGVEKSPLKVDTNLELKKEEICPYLDGNESGDDCKKDIHKLQIESLERVLAEQRKENAILRERVKEQVDELQERDQTFKELEKKIDLMSKRVDQAEREKDAAVMRYASVECQAIEARRAADKAAAAEKAALAEIELMNIKLKSAHSEKARICQLYDDKCHELSNTERELAKVREDIKELEGRLKWTQSKLRMEMDAYKESTERCDKLAQQVSELEAAKDAAVTNATDSARAKQLEQELKESQAALILSRHEKEDLQRRLTSITQQLDSCKRERDSTSVNLAACSAEVERLKESNLRLEEEAAELAALRAQAALADTLSGQLQREIERATQAEEALSVERARAETCARREAAALAHAATLTALHVHSKQGDSDTEHKAQALAMDNASLREKITSLEAECARLQAALAEESEKRNKETRALARKVAEITEEAADAAKKLEWEKGENAVLKKKHANAIKELNRELQRALKRCDQLEAKLPSTEANGHRTGSISSLSSSESAQHNEEIQNHVQNGHTDTLPDIQLREPDKQTLIERIVSLQRAAARRSERCEFLEEHARQLTGELRAKSRLLRNLLCSLPAGALASSHSDAHKKEIARLGGGAMAAVWGGEATGMTLELSLEMNNKLQAVLEDALLKNITLKENLDTLGEEIARLKEQRNSIDNKSKS